MTEIPQGIDDQGDSATGQKNGAASQARAPFRVCALIPTYDNPETVRSVAEQVRKFIPDVLVVDDHSATLGEQACAALEADGTALVRRRERNGGKGAAVKTGFAFAREQGFTHAFQVDADGQHDLTQIPKFLEIARANPDALLLGCPEYDGSAPRHRVVARKFTRLWVNLEVGGAGIIEDSMIGFRIYPIEAALSVPVWGDRMDFDIEVAVRMVWAGVRTINIPVPVRYLSEEEGGLSHFQPLRDNLRFAALHCRLCTMGCTIWCMRKVGLIKR